MSVASLTFDQNKKEYSIDLRMFLDDYLVITGSLEEENNPYGKILATPSKNEIKNYLKDHLLIYFNDQLVELKIDKLKTEDVTIHIIIELKTEIAPNQINQIKVEDTIYVDQFINQRNIIHINLPGKSRKSLLFNKYQRVLSAEWD